MERFQARLTVVKGPVYAFDQRMRVGDVIVREVTKFDSGEMVQGKGGLQNPKGYETMEVGYRDVPCIGCFRVEPINVDPKARVVPMRDRIIDALGKLDHTDPTQWTAKGEPKVDAVSAIVGDRVTSDEIAEARPGFKRELSKSDG